MRIFISVFVLIVTITASAKDQTGDIWWAYLAEYKKGSGSTTLNLTINNRAPVSTYRYLLKVVDEYKGRKDGLPTEKAFKLLYKISDHRHQFILNRTKAIRVGTFTANGMRTEYYYVPKKIAIVKALNSFYKKNYPELKHNTSVKVDAQWKQYKKFLFPGKALVEYYKKSLIKYGYLKPDGTVVDEQIKKFWVWFKNSNFKLNILNSNKQLKKVASLISPELHKINKNITWEVGRDKELVISANGDRKYFSLVQRVVTAAPGKTGWRIMAFRQRVNNLDHLEVKFSDVSLNPFNMWFKLYRKNKSTYMKLCIKGYKQKPGMAYKSLSAHSKRYIKAAYILLDASLGEYDATVNIDGIGFCPLPLRPMKEGLKPLVKLPLIFDRLRKKLAQAGR